MRYCRKIQQELGIPLRWKVFLGLMAFNKGFQQHIVGEYNKNYGQY